MLLRISTLSRLLQRHISLTNVVKNLRKLPRVFEVEELSPVIGLEIHAQVKSNSKLFSGAENKFMAPSNSLVSNYDAAMPGTLPVINVRCVEAAVVTALALNCKLNLKSHFDRKHYFYADMPQGYQITQQRCPIAVGGHFNFSVSDGETLKKVHIQQIQLEQDSGKSLHDDIGNQTCIDLNRANVGLLEIVTCPDLSGVDDTCAFVRELQMTLKTLEVCEGKMQEGQLRVDVNLSIKQKDGSHGSRAEIKNISGISALKNVIEYEIQRQKHIIKNGGKIEQETRHYDEVTGVTVSMRDKKEKQDYRFMPEPNLPPLVLYTDENTPEQSTRNFVNVDELRRRMPRLPGELRQTLMQQHGLTHTQASFLLENNLATYYYDVLSLAPALPTTLLYNWMKIKLVELQRKSAFTTANCVVSPQELADLLLMENRKEINQDQSKQAFELALEDTRTPVQVYTSLLKAADILAKNTLDEDVFGVRILAEIARDRDWVVIADESVIAAFVGTAIDQLSREIPEFSEALKKRTSFKDMSNLVVDRSKLLSGGKCHTKILSWIAGKELKKKLQKT